MKEKEEEIKRLRKELEACQSEDPDASLPACMYNFSRSEMARVVMEKNQYKQRLLELQEAVRRSQTLRATQDERSTEDKRTAKEIWVSSPMPPKRNIGRRCPLSDAGLQYVFIATDERPRFLP
ncbi:C-Jun-amino-terminal kinase-interacting protein 4 [Liparis tanakae]|uniref:C-Jun-amino-terminal kinase-interacting protein 4 n=1 Tax=Liparis tanakae TaxID=230148 RepID=A0A4Z2I7X6_9TELE|nr:C-Jun-amino-terminal kinase-interacting protein 4 [Liparis tanakae]